MTNKSRVVLYTGVTNDLDRRVWEHQHGELKGFTKNIESIASFTMKPTTESTMPSRVRKKLKAGVEVRKTRWWRRLIRDGLICQSSFSAVCEVPRRASPTRDDMVERR
jgi:putative endonuclease